MSTPHLSRISRRAAHVLAVLLPLSSASAQEPDPAPAPGADVPRIDLVPFGEGQPLALSVDDRGRLYAAMTARAFGRGTVSATGFPAWEAEDRALQSVAAREQALERWQEAGWLDQLRQRQPKAFPAGDSAAFLTRYTESIACFTGTGGEPADGRLLTVADGFLAPADGPGGALLALPGNRWLYGCPPALWRLEDTTGNGRADRRDPVITGLGVRAGDYTSGIHALLEGVDGWVYFGLGDRGWHFIDGRGRIRRGLRQGAIFRCRPDGQEAEVFATGFHNPTGLAMDARGNLFAVDAATPDGKTRVIHVIEGADYGWRDPGPALATSAWRTEDYGTRLASAPGSDFPEWMALPFAGVEESASSLTADPGSGLPDVWRGWFFAGDVREDGAGGVRGWEFRPEGSSFTLGSTRDLWKGGAVTDAVFGPDAALYFVSWGARVDALSSCEVRKLTWPAAQEKDRTQDDTAVLTTGFTNLPVKAAKALLENANVRVRMRAQQHLASLPFQESLEALLHIARRSTVLEARLHGLWGVAALARQDRALLNELTLFLNDPEPHIRMIAVRLLGEAGAGGSPTSALRALRDPDTAVRREAALALARLQPSGILPQLLDAVIVENDSDRLTRNALARALAACVPGPELLYSAADHASRPVRMAAVLALRLQEDENVSRFLTDPDPAVAAEAARAIWDLPLTAGIPALADALPRASAPGGMPSSFVRRALAAAVFRGTPEDASRVGEFVSAAPARTPEPLRLAALDLLAGWDTPPAVDPLSGEPLLPLPRLPGNARDAIRTHLKEMAKATPPSALTTRAATLLAGPGSERSADQWLQLLLDPAAAEPARRDAFRRLAKSGGARLLDACRTLLQTGPTPADLRADARAWQVKHDPRNAISWVNEALATGTPAERQRAVATLDLMVGNEYDRYMLELGRRMATGSVDPVIMAEVVQSVTRHNSETRSNWQRAWENYEATIPEDTDPLAAWRPAAAPGDPVAGQELYLFHGGTRCTSCHALNGRGGSSGPALDGVGTRLNPSLLLRALVHPSALTSPPWSVTTVTLTDGHTLYGTILEKSGDSLRLATSEGIRTLTSAEIEESSEPLSPMPPAGAVLSLRELRDLVAFLGTLK